jgi:hypothetical protein
MVRSPDGDAHVTSGRSTCGRLQKRQFHLFRDGVRLGKMSEFRGDDFFVGVIREHLPGTCRC